MGARYVGLGKESSYGAGVDATRFLEAVADIEPDQGWVIPTPVVDRAYRKRNLGPYRARGSIGDFLVEPENIGELLAAAIGVDQKTTPASGVYLHNFVIVGSEFLPSYTIHLGVEQIERILAGCLVEQLTLKFAHDNDIKANAQIFSGFVESKADIGAPVLSTLQALNMRDANSVLTVGGTSERNTVFDLEVSIKNNIPFERGDLNGRTFNTKRSGLREVTGKLSAYFDNTNLYDKFIAGNEFNLLIQAIGPVITGQYKYYLELDLRKCVFMGGVPGVKAQNEPLIADAPFKAFYDPSVQYEIKAKLQNTVSAAY